MSTGQRTTWSFVPREERSVRLAHAEEVLVEGPYASGRIAVWQDVRDTRGRAAAL